LKNKPALTIQRIPQDTLLAFKQLAKDQFCDDYGMALKWLIDNAVIQETLLDLHERLSTVEHKLTSKDDKKDEIKTLDGKMLKR